MGGVGAGVGTRAGNGKKDSPHQAIEWGGAGKRAGGRVFRGRVRPVTNSIPSTLPLLGYIGLHSTASILRLHFLLTSLPASVPW